MNDATNMGAGLPPVVGQGGDPWRDVNDFRDSDLTPAERQRVRRLLMDDERIHKTVVSDERALWFWSTVRVWVLWIGGVAVALTATMTWVKDIIKMLRGG